MKKKLIIAVLLSLAVLSMYQCKKEENDQENETPVPTIDTLEELLANVVGQEIETELDLTPFEESIKNLSSDEQLSECTTISEDESALFAQAAEEVISLNRQSLTKSLSDKIDDFIDQHVINVNRFEDQYEIEQIIWNSGTWGASHWGNFSCFYTTVMTYEGDKYLIVVMYKETGFEKDGTAYLKLGTVNSGKIMAKVPYKAHKKYILLPYKLDNTGAGCVNLFPLLIGENGYRSYLNPVMIKTKPLMVNGWSSLDYGESFGSINGVDVICNTGTKKNIGSGKYQCVELCRRYLVTMHPELVDYNCCWGHANEWPYNRRNDKRNPDKFLVFENDGENQVREGDIIVFQHGKYGHVAVVIKVTPEYISIAHQNGAIGDYDWPIGTKLAKKGNKVLSNHPDLNYSPIYGYSDNYISHFIRFNSKFEHPQPVIQEPEQPEQPEDPEDPEDPEEPESPMPVITATLSATSVEVGGSVMLTVDTDVDCKISYAIGTTPYSYYTRTNLPTDTEGDYTVTITATATDGGKSSKTTLYYTVTKKDEPKPTEVNLTLGNLPSKVYKGDNATLYFSTGGVPCKIEYQYGTLSKETYSDNATQGYVPLFTTNGASDVKLTIYATPLDNLQKTYDKSVVYDVEYRFTVNFNEPSGSSFAVGAVKYFEVHSPYHSVDASFEYYQHSDLNEYPEDFNQYSHKLYTDEPGHYKIYIKAVSRTNPDDYDTYTYEYDVEQEEEEQNPPEISFDEDSGLHIDVGEDFTLTITTDQTCKIKAYDDNDDLIDSESDTKRLVIDVPTDFEVGTYYIKVKVRASDGTENEEEWKYRLDPVRLKDAKTDKTISFNGRQYALEPNPDGFVVDYRGKGIFRVYKSDGRNFGRGGDFYIYSAGDFESFEDGMNCYPDICYPIAHEEKDGDEFYDLKVRESYKGTELYLFECHENDGGYYIGPFTY